MWEWVLYTEGWITLACSEPSYRRVVCSLSNHCLGVCLKPIKSLVEFADQREICSFKPWRLFACFIYTVSWSKPFRKALLTSSWRRSQLFVIAKVMMSLIVTGFTTGEKVSLKSKQGSWWKPLATSRRALNLLMDPSTFSFYLKHPLTTNSLPVGWKVKEKKERRKFEILSHWFKSEPI